MIRVTLSGVCMLLYGVGCDGMGMAWHGMGWDGDEGSRGKIPLLYEYS